LGDLHNKVLVTDVGGCRGDLLIVRSLGRRNIGTTLMTQGFFVPSMFSRWRSETVYCPSSFDDLEGFFRTLLMNARTGKYLTLFPLTDCSLLAVSERRKQLTPNLKLVLPSHKSVLEALDKSKTLRIAEEVGTPTPKTFHARTRAEIINLSARIQYPAVIKPRWSYFRKRSGEVKFSRPFYVNSSSELISTYTKVETDFPSPMIQEYVPGHNISVATLFDRGEPKVACFIRVKRTLPVTGGNSVLRESIPPDPKLLRYASNLLRRLNWHGVAEVEFRIDSRDSTPKLMEINPRFWGSMNVAIESGVDFPYLLYSLAKGEQIRPIFKYRLGVKFRWWNADSENLRSTLRGEPKLINMKAPNKLDAVLRFLQFCEKDMHYDGFALSDPLPFFMDEVSYVYGNAKNTIRHAWLRARVLQNPRLARVGNK
jgi:predicted ATP-grasp superfamily ATP-dependent carboligase